MKLFKTVKIISVLFWESVCMAFSSLKTDRLRTNLSLLGVTVGVFSIIAILTVVDSIETTLDDNLRSLGNNVIYVQTIPFEDETDENGESIYTAEDYLRRPAVTYSDYIFLRENMTLENVCVFFNTFSTYISFSRNSLVEVPVYVVSEGFENLFSIDVKPGGRLLTSYEYENNTASVVLGHDVAVSLFQEDVSPEGKNVILGGIRAEVVGVLDKMGKMLIQVFDFDNAVIMSVPSASVLFPVESAGGTIMSVPGKGVDNAGFRNELEKNMRNLRRLKPGQKNNFALNEINYLRKMMARLFVMVSGVGWFLAAFSLIIGGFGIANIMFVSVREKTRQIGIQKALGAPRHTILFQYLMESSTLSVTGGFIGIVLVWITVLVVQSVEINGTPVNIFLDFQNVLTGIIVAVVIGIVSGFSPASFAARLDPVEAISAE